MVEDRIVLSDLRLRGRHGVDPHERTVEQEFAVDLACPTDAARAAASDELADALDYRRLAEIAAVVIAGPPHRLIETLADDIAHRVLDELGVRWVHVRVTKLAPGGIPGRASVELTRSREPRPRPHASVELHVPDFARVKDFYGQLGFRIAREESGERGYLVLELEGNTLAFWPGSVAVARHPHFGRFPADAPRGAGVEIVIAVADVEALYTRALALGPVVAPLQLRSWGVRDFRLLDPFGYYLRITE